MCTKWLTDLCLNKKQQLRRKVDVLDIVIGKLFDEHVLIYLCFDFQESVVHARTIHDTTRSTAAIL